MLKTFKGGLHVPDNKNTHACPIEKLPAPARVYIPMQQHIGAPAQPLVQKGDYVKKGQLIGNFENGLSCPIH
ncbi:MAG: electron transporter RnfC, partial [Clostridia bacterium]|nr:electron transporter RnfC [Clostridia bacterium]